LISRSVQKLRHFKTSYFYLHSAERMVCPRGEGTKNESCCDKDSGATKRLLAAVMPTFGHTSEISRDFQSLFKLRALTKLINKNVFCSTSIC